MTINNTRGFVLFNIGSLCLLVTVLAGFARRHENTGTIKTGTVVIHHQQIQARANFSSEAFPKRIHQLWLGYDAETPYKQWRNASDTTRRNNPDFEYKLWTSEDVINLLLTYYPWFLITYFSYQHDVQRADVARYFITMHHGGVYLDMDTVSSASLSNIINNQKLRAYDCLLPAQGKHDVIGNVIMCKRGSPFLTHVISALCSHNTWHVTNYATIAWSTGPHFLRGVLDKYRDKESVYVMTGRDVTDNFESVFGHVWYSHRDVIFQITGHMVGAVVICIALFTVFIFIRRIRSRVINNNTINIDPMV